MYPVITLFGWPVKSYTLFAALSALTGLILAYRTMRGLRRIQRILLLTAVSIAYLIGARLWNVAVNPDSFGPDRPWYVLRMTGFSLYGGLVGAVLAVFLYARISGNRAGLILDGFVVPFGVAFCISRIGCFLNGCCGGIRTDLPWGVVFPTRIEIHTALITLKSPHVHPTQLYELIAALAGLPLCLYLAKRCKAEDGGLFGLYSAWFCLMRLAILPLRALPYAEVITKIVYPAVYAALAALGLVLFIRSRRQSLNATRRETT